MDILFWPSVDLILWGFISTFIDKMDLEAPNAIALLLGAIILWTIFRRSQQDVALAFLEDIWYRNVINLFVSPLKVSEYIVGGVVVAVIKNAFVLVYMGALAAVLYHFNIITFGLSLVPFIVMLGVFGWAVGIFLCAIIFRFGTESQILAFSVSFLIQPISAVFYPVTVLPPFLQKIAWSLPTTSIFEGMRGVIGGAGFSMNLFWLALGLNAVYLFLACLFYAWMFRRVRELGLISKVE
jgi:ABC-2 type transport system permease protein